jgi:predicted DNA-binding transcriptional regulator YafY
MSLSRYLKKVRFIDYLICKKATGSQKELANRVGVSISTINEYLNEMKEAGFPIRYCHKRQTYYYEKNGGMVKSLFSEELTREDMRKISGGKAAGYFLTNCKPLFKC